MSSDKLKWVEKSYIFPYYIKNDEYLYRAVLLVLDIQNQQYMN